MSRQWNPAISVILAVYNGDRHLAACLDSLRAQTLKNFECIIVDDASIDSTADILNAYARKDIRFRIFRNEQNRERCYSRNLAVSKANADIIAVMDADDLAAPERLEHQLAYMQKHPGVGVLGSAYKCYETKQQINLPLDDEKIRAMLLFNNCIAHSSMCFRKEVFLRLGGYDENYPPTEDYDFLCRFALQSDMKMTNLPQFLLVYRLNEEQNRAAYFERQNALADKVRRYYIKMCGFSLSEAEMEAFLRLASWKVPKNISELKAAQHVLEKLQEQNQKNRKFNDDVLNTIIYERWHFLCYMTHNVFSAVQYMMSSRISGGGKSRLCNAYSVLKCAIKVNLKIFLKKLQGAILARGNS